ncbi:MAG: prepilin-type N-terminal cleavage/methylation domain-containing protein [Planctomycetota bacterium]
MSRSSRPRGLTLVELLVAVALGVVLVGVAARVFQTGVRTYTRSLERVDARRVLDTPARRLQDDAHLALPVIDLEDAFAPRRVEQAFGEPGGEQGVTRLDELQLTCLRGAPPRLARVRFRVADWDPVQVRGTLRREVRAVRRDELPQALEFLASRAPDEDEVLLQGVRRFQLAICDELTEVVEPPAEPREWAERYLYEGRRGVVEHDLLRPTSGTKDLSRVRAGALVWLKHDVMKEPQLVEGYYPVQEVLASGALRLGLRGGWTEQVAYRASWLPRGVTVRLEVATSEGPAALDLELELGGAAALREALQEAVWANGGVPVGPDANPELETQPR